MIIRAVLYARVSGDDRGKDSRNLNGQIDMCREYALSHGYLVVAELAEDDRGASGASFDLPELNRALEMSRAQEIDVIIVREIDRFARSLAKQLIVEQEFKRNGVKIEYVFGEYPDTPEGSLNKNIKAVIAEYERLKISERMVRGRRQKVKAGHILAHGKPPFGYRIVEVNGRCQFEIIEEEAEVVHKIFEWFIEGDGVNGRLPIRKICKKLTEEKALVPKTRKRSHNRWARPTINRILRSETYAGIWRYGKFGNKDGKRFLNPEEHFLEVEVPAIVSREVWKAAQKQIENNKLYSMRNQKYNYLVGKRVTCGSCGYKMLSSGTLLKEGQYLYYRCSAARGYDDYTRECSNARYFRVDRVDSTIWKWIKRLLEDPEALNSGLLAYQQEREAMMTPLLERQQVIEDLLTEHRSQLQKILDLYLEGSFTKELLLERRKRLETTIAALETEYSNITSNLQIQHITPEQIAGIKEFTAEVAKGLKLAEGDFQTRRRIIEVLDVRVTLSVEDDQQVAYVKCIFGDDSLLIESRNTYRKSKPESHSPGSGRRSAHVEHTVLHRYIRVSQLHVPSG